MARVFSILLLASVFTALPLRSAHALNIIEGNQRLQEQQEHNEALEVYRHNLNYFITGQPDTKVQLSFKVRLLKKTSLYGAYTQTMFWDLFKNSSPFTDLNYNPELFYRWYLDSGMLKGLDLGLEHRSNGRGGETSRSWNRVYVTARTQFKTFGVDTEWNTKAFVLLPDPDTTTPDLNIQLGFLETSLVFKNLLSQWLEDAQFDITLIPGGTIELTDIRGSREFGFRFRLPISDLKPFLYMQVYSGFNESQLFYKDNRTTYRVGLAL